MRGRLGRRCHLHARCLGGKNRPATGGAEVPVPSEVCSLIGLRLGLLALQRGLSPIDTLWHKTHALLASLNLWAPNLTSRTGHGMHHDLNMLVGYAVIQYGSAAHGGVMKNTLPMAVRRAYINTSLTNCSMDQGLRTLR